MKKLLCLLTAIVLLLGLVGCRLPEDKNEIVAHTSPDENYTLTLYQVGSPQWSFGSVSAKLVLTDADGAVVHKEDISFNNDGGGVEEDNIVNVVWGDTSVEVELRHFDTTQRNFYTIPYDGGEVTCSTTFVEASY